MPCRIIRCSSSAADIRRAADGRLFTEAQRNCSASTPASGMWSIDLDAGNRAMPCGEEKEEKELVVGELEKEDAPGAWE